MGDSQKVCLRTYTLEARHIFMRQGKSGRELVADAKKFYYLSLPSTNIQNLRIGDVDPDSYLLDNEVQYLFLDKLMEIGVLAIWSNQFRLT